jgi:hypothetical protein
VKDDTDTAGEPMKSGITHEVGDEGGTPGDVEIDKDVIGGGSEAGETWRPADTQVREIVRDDTGEGRRTP